MVEEGQNNMQTSGDLTDFVLCAGPNNALRRCEKGLHIALMRPCEMSQSMMGELYDINLQVQNFTINICIATSSMVLRTLERACLRIVKDFLTTAHKKELKKLDV